LRFDYPIGTDAPATLSTTRSFLSDSDKIEFGSSPSAGSPGLYIIYTFLSDITKTGLLALATYLPPVINMASLVFFYIFIRRFFEPRSCLLAVFVSGWEHTVFKFGFEYRTQESCNCFVHGSA
jgi:hypothetical protein